MRINVEKNTTRAARGLLQHILVLPKGTDMPGLFVCIALNPLIAFKGSITWV